MSATTTRSPSLDISDSSPEQRPVNRTTADLAASCHVVSGAARQIHERLFAADHRFPGRSPGVQLDVLAEHCKQALIRQTIRDVLLIVCALLAFFTLIPSLLAAALIVLAERVVAYRITRQIKTGNYTLPKPEMRTPLSEAERKSLDNAKACQNGNVNIYSGFEPFVDAGSRLGGWSFAMSVKRGKSTLRGAAIPQPFESVEAYEAVCAAIEALAVPGCTITDVVCASGRELRDNRVLLPSVESRPVCAVPRAFATALIDAEDERARLYKLIRVEAWDGELVMSMYFRFRKQADTLFVEVSFHVLPPLQERFHVLERMNAEVSWRTLVAEVSDWLLSIPMLVIGPLRLLLGVLGWPVRAFFLRESARRRALRDDPTTDYGCHQSLRSWASSSSYGNYFQRLDKEMFVKTIECRLLEALQQFLDEKGIDTTDIRARQETILNSGVIVSGNNFQESNVSIARKAQNAFSRSTSSASTNLA